MTSPLRSFIAVPPDSHFSIQNLPFGVFQPRDGNPRVGVAIGDLIVDLSILEEFGHFRSSEFQDLRVFSEASLNGFLRRQRGERRARSFNIFSQLRRLHCVTTRGCGKKFSTRKKTL